MAKTITIDYKGQTYTLEYNRQAIIQLERSGFDINKIQERPVDCITTLFRSAFFFHHKDIKQSLVDEIYDTLPDKRELLRKLTEMYQEPYADLLEEKGDNEGNAKWGANW